MLRPAPLALLLAATSPPTVAQLAELPVREAPGPGGFLGRAVAFNSDGTYLAVTEPENSMPLDQRGDVWIYRNDGDALTLVRRLELPPNLTSVIFGDRMVWAGHDLFLADSRANQQRGHVVVFRDATGATPSSQVLEPGSALTGPGLFGRALAVSLDETRVYIARPADSQGGPQFGAVFVYEKIGGSWLSIAQIVNQDPNLIAIGTALAATENGLIFRTADRSLHVFEETTPLQWTIVQSIPPQPSITASDYAFELEYSDGALFVGDNRFDGAPFITRGRVHLYERDQTGAFAYSGFFTSSGATLSQVSGDAFGSSIAVSNGRLAVGAPTGVSPASGSTDGIVFVFDRRGTDWARRTVVTAPTADVTDNVASSLDMRGSWIAAGSPNWNGLAVQGGRVFAGEVDLGEIGCVFSSDCGGAPVSRSASLKLFGDSTLAFGSPRAIAGPFVNDPSGVVLIASPSQSAPAPVNNVEGCLCIGTPAMRLGFAPVADGTSRFDFANADLPGLPGTMVGSTTTFQAWYRSASPSGAGSATTNAVTLGWF